MVIQVLLLALPESEFFFYDNSKWNARTNVALDIYSALVNLSLFCMMMMSMINPARPRAV
jgi:hypothetical protein